MSSCFSSFRALQCDVLDLLHRYLNFETLASPVQDPFEFYNMSFANIKTPNNKSQQAKALACEELAHYVVTNPEQKLLW